MVHHIGLFMVSHTIHLPTLFSTIGVDSLTRQNDCIKAPRQIKWLYDEATSWIFWEEKGLGTSLGEIG